MSSAAGVEHRDGAAVLRPARDVVAHRDRPLLAVRDGAHAISVDAARDHIVAHRLRAAGAERDIVLARAALVGMTFDGEAVLGIVLQPLHLLVERGARLRRQLARIGLEENAVADIHDEVLGASRHGGAGAPRARLLLAVGVVRARGQPDHRHHDGGQFRGAEDGRNTHTGGSPSKLDQPFPRYRPKSLIEGSVNLYAVLPGTTEARDRPETLLNG